MSINHEAVRSLEQQETGEMRVLRCLECGARAFGSLEQLSRHQRECGALSSGAAHAGKSS